MVDLREFLIISYPIGSWFGGCEAPAGICDTKGGLIHDFLEVNNP